MRLKHTPTPWSLGRQDDYSVKRVIETANDYIASCDGSESEDVDEANAAFIVLAVNNHDNLVATLKALIAVHRQQDTTGVMPADKAIAYGQVEAAIAKVDAS